MPEPDQSIAWAFLITRQARSAHEPDAPPPLYRGRASAPPSIQWGRRVGLVWTSCLALFHGRMARHDGLRRPETIHGGADDAAGVARSLADRIQPLQPRRRPVVLIA